MHAFAKTQQGISAAVMTDAITALDEAGFSPDRICDASMARTRELTGFLEGQVLALDTFCAKWVDGMARKRRRVMGE
jgi:hypothetical protein